MTTLDPGPAPADARRAPVAVLTPGTLDEALRLLAADDTAVLGGGVRHSLDRHARLPEPAAALVSVADLPELAATTWHEDRVTIGAGVRLAALAADARLAAVWPVVTEAAGLVATARIRRLVTLGGNIAAHDETHDPPVALAAVGAALAVRGARGARTLPVGEVGRLRDDELIEHVTLPLPAARTGSSFQKFLVRGLWEYACVHVGAVVRLDGAGAAQRLSLAVGSVEGGPVAVDLADLVGRPFDDALVDRAARAAASATRPRSDVRGTAAYKTCMIEEFARRALAEAGRRAAPHTPTGGER